MMRLASLFVACAIFLAPVAIRTAEAASPSAKPRPAVKRTSKKKPAASEKSSVRPTKITRTLRPGALTVAVGHEINEDAKVTPFPSFGGHAQKALAQNRRDSVLD